MSHPAKRHDEQGAQTGSNDGQSLCCSSPPSGGGTSGVDRVNVRLQADQPVVPVPVYQEIYKRDKYIEVPRVELHDTVIPKVYNQATVHEVPKIEITFKEKEVDVEATKEVEREVEVPVLVGYAPQFVPKWDVREVPRPVPKYEGEQEVIEVEVPQIEYKDRYVEKEVVVDVKEKIVPKVTEVVKEVEVMQYEWKEQFQDVPVYKYVPKFDVELDCPPPMIVPYPAVNYVKDPPETIQPYCDVLCGPCTGEQHLLGNQSSERVYLKQREFMPSYPASPMVAVGGVRHSTVPRSLPGTEEHQPSSVQPSHPSAVQTAYLPESQTLQGSLPINAVHLPPGPVFPLPSPQADRHNGGHTSHPSVAEKGQKIPEKKAERKGFWSWLFGPKDVRSDAPALQPQQQLYSYPEGTPTDFTPHFQRQLQQEALSQSAKATSAADEAPGAGSESGQSELEPTVTYRGAVSMPPEYAGDLLPISFKLHAVEIHQFVPLPNVEVPEFVRALPDGFMSADVTHLDKFFGPMPSGWADPDVTGIPAPMMSDILAGNVQAASASPLVNQLSKQFVKQGASGAEAASEAAAQHAQDVAAEAAETAAFEAAAAEAAAAQAAAVEAAAAEANARQFTGASEHSRQHHQ